MGIWPRWGVYYTRTLPNDMSLLGPFTLGECEFRRLVVRLSVFFVSCHLGMCLLKVLQKRVVDIGSARHLPSYNDPTISCQEAQINQLSIWMLQKDGMCSWPVDVFRRNVLSVPTMTRSQVL